MISSLVKKANRVLAVAGIIFWTGIFHRITIHHPLVNLIHYSINLILMTTQKKNLGTLVQMFALSFVFMFAAFAVAGVVHADTLTRSLDDGMSGADVSSLQTFLAKDTTLYPQGLVTGYFGNLTAAAVSRFQTRNGIEAVGRVGPITRAALNAQMGGVVSNPGNAGSAPIIYSVTVSPSTNSASVAFNTNEAARGVVYYSANPLTTYERINAVDVSGATAATDVNYHTAQNVVVQGLSSNTTYFYLIYTTDQDGNVSVTWPSTFRTN